MTVQAHSTTRALGEGKLRRDHEAGIIDSMPETLRADVAVIGSGPGGAITACLLAEAGRDVLMIEEGPYLPLGTCKAFSVDEMIQKYRAGGLTVAMGPTKVAYVEGRCVGGGSEINSGLYHRTPPEILKNWRREFGVEALQYADLEPHFEACERDLSISHLPGPAPAASLKLHEGASRLGWKSLEVPRWYRYDPPTEGSTESRGVRQSMTATYIPRALRAGCRLLPGTRVDRIRRSGSRWQLRGTLRPEDKPRQSVRIEAGTLFVCGGAIQTPALLRRSGITRNIGNSLRMHPTVKVIARFPDEVNSTRMDVPVHQVKEFAPRFSFGCSISSPGHLALGLTDHSSRLADLPGSWRHMATYYAMITGQGSGTLRVIPGSRDPFVRYRLAPEDLGDLSVALRNLCRVLFEAGAVELFPSIGGVEPLRSLDDLARLPSVLPQSRTNLMTIHLTSSCPLGENQQRCAADSHGRIHGIEGLHIADASLLCTPPSVNPQGSIMAIARRNALEFLDR